MSLSRQGTGQRYPLGYCDVYMKALCCLSVSAWLCMGEGHMEHGF